MNQALESIRLLRPQSYLKQIFVLLPCLSMGNSIEFIDLRNISVAVISFSLMASSIYVLNDIEDLPRDKLHPYKKHRPLASGQVGIRVAFLMAGFSFIASLLLLLVISANRFYLVLTLLCYLILNIFYTSLHLKKYNLLGMTFVALGFPLRFTFGTIAINSQFSYWACLLAFLIALFLLTGKRIQQEQSSITGEPRSANFFHLNTFGGLFLASYIGFILQPSTQSTWGSSLLIITPIPISLIVARYYELIVFSKNVETMDITESFYKDPFLFFSGFVYVVIMFAANLTT